VDVAAIELPSFNESMQSGVVGAIDMSGKSQEVAAKTYACTSLIISSLSWAPCSTV
jgi:hypothetical protein